MVLGGVDLELRRGEVTLLLGPSGAGKSSLALTLNGLIPHQMDGEIRGEAWVEGRSTQEATVPWLTSRVGMVFQDPDAQIATLTVEDEVAFGMENLMLPPEQMPQRIEGALRQVGMEGMGLRSTEALSGGQKQRLALASTLAMGVSVLVFDEPTANLDPAGTSEFFALLAGLKEEGATVFIIEHKLDELIEQVDSVVVLDYDGKVAASGHAREVMQKEAALLDRLGVWVPQVVELAGSLAKCGISLDPYPLTVEEAAVALDRSLPSGRVFADRQASRVSGNALAEGPPAVEVTGLSYSYPEGEIALRGVDLTVERGDFFALVGPNGSGKTTLARHLIGLVRPQRGEVRLFGDDVGRLSGRDMQHRAGYVFQNPEHQFVTLKVYDELAYSLRARKMPEEEVARSVELLLLEFGLEPHRDANPFSLSQGQKRRLSVATMLALDPQLLILDEPTFGQDRLNTARIMEHLGRLNSRGVTVIVITHDMKLVAECASTVGVMLEGRIEFKGAVGELFSNPALLREARLAVPPVLKVSRLLGERRPGFPLLTTVGGFMEEICARSGTYPAAASSTS